MLGARGKQVCARLARCGSAWRRSRGALGLTMIRSIKWASVSAVAGSVFPVGYLCVYYTGILKWFPDWGLYLWPTSLMLLATDGHEANHLLAAKVITLSLVSNAIIWFVGGILISKLWAWRAATVSGANS